jgi:hypothetical protein
MCGMGMSMAYRPGWCWRSRVQDKCCWGNAQGVCARCARPVGASGSSVHHGWGALVQVEPQAGTVLSTSWT